MAQWVAAGCSVGLHELGEARRLAIAFEALQYTHEKFVYAVQGRLQQVGDMVDRRLQRDLARGLHNLQAVASGK